MTAASDRKHIGLYARVSTRDKHQDPELQLGPMREFVRARGWQATEYVDHASATDAVGRRQWARLMSDVRTHRIDLVMCWKLDRCFRSSLDALRALQELDHAGVGFRCHTQELDTTTATGRLVFTILAAVAEMERDLIRERVKAGIDKARADGKRLGRPKRTTLPQEHRQWPVVLKALEAGHLTRKEAAKKLGVRYVTFQKALPPSPRHGGSRNV